MKILVNLTNHRKNAKIYVIQSYLLNIDVPICLHTIVCTNETTNQLLRKEKVTNVNLGFDGNYPDCWNAYQRDLPRSDAPCNHVRGNCNPLLLRGSQIEFRLCWSHYHRTGKRTWISGEDGNFCHWLGIQALYYANSCLL